MRIAKNSWKALTIFFIGLLLTIAATVLTHREAEEQADKEFVDVCDDIVHKISVRMQAHALFLRTTAAFFEASDTVTRLRWKMFNDQARLDQKLPGILGAGYSVIIPKDHLRQHIEAIRKEGFPAYTVRPSGDRSFYTSIIYIEPFSERNRRAFGYDMFSEPIRRKAMELARDSDMATLSGKVVLVQETEKDKQAGTLMYVPVYKSSMPIETIDQRRAAILGWVYSPYRMNDLMLGILGRWDFIGRDRISLEIFDGSATDNILIYNSMGKESRNLSKEAFRKYSLPLELCGRQWTMHFTQKEDQIIAFQSKELFVLFSGLSISLLLFFLFLTILNTRTKAQKIADSLTIDLKEREKQFEAIANYSASWESWFSKEGKLLWMNSYCEVLTGFTPSECIASTDVLSMVVAPEDLDLVMGRFVQALQGESGSNFEARFKRKDGSKFWLSVSWRPIFDAAGNSIGIRTSGTDVSARKQDEEVIRKLSLAVVQSPVSVIITDLEGKIEYVNGTAAQTTGYSQDEILGQRPNLFKSGETADEEYRILWKTITSGGQWSGTFHNKKKDGTLYWEAATISPIFDSNGIITHYLGIKEDITSKKKAHDELITSEANLKEANATKDKLFSIIAHDLRGPIGNISMILELLNHDNNLQESDRALFMDSLMQGSQNAFSLLENLLRWASSQAHKIEVKPAHIPVNAIIHRNIDLLSPVASGKSVTILTNITDNSSIYADEDSIDIVFRNLLSNAIKFSRTKGIINISSRDSGDFIEIEVADNGVGIKEEIAIKLFSKNSFYTTQGTNKEKGTGLGLVLCKDFVAQNGGKIWVESIFGQGSKFIFTVPKSNSNNN